MRICEGLEVLDVAVMPGFYIHPTVVWDEGGAVLIDAGVPLETLSAAFAEAGIAMDRLARVIVTHQDMDHIGGLARLKREHGVEVLAHELEVPYIEGEKPNIKMTPERLAALEEHMKTLPDDQRRIAAAVRTGGNVKVDTPLQGGEVLPYCGGIEVIHTPGHTPGHISLYLRAHKALVAGDAMNVMDGQLMGPAPEHTYDLPTALASLRKLAALDLDLAICHHGGVVRRPQERIRELALGAAE